MQREHRTAVLWNGVGWPSADEIEQSNRSAFGRADHKFPSLQRLLYRGLEKQFVGSFSHRLSTLQVGVTGLNGFDLLREGYLIHFA